MFSSKLQRLLTSKLAGLQYLGITGITAPCLSAITQVISGDELVLKAFLLSCNSYHAFILVTEFNKHIAIKPGFTSGYAGEGPCGLANALTLLHQHNIETDEYSVDTEFLDRIAYSCLLQSDIEFIESADPVRPQRWHDYVYDLGLSLYSDKKNLARYYPSGVPFGLIDERIIDLAIKFRGNEDAAIISAFRRLEDLVRKRTGLLGEGVKLFSKAFLSDDSPLGWDVPDEAEAKGRANLFNATFMAYRNARVHREVERYAMSSLREFLLVNELFHLEAESLTKDELEKKRADDKLMHEMLDSFLKE